jgi:hypothetical protein
MREIMRGGRRRYFASLPQEALEASSEKVGEAATRGRDIFGSPRSIVAATRGRVRYKHDGWDIQRGYLRIFIGWLSVNYGRRSDG